MTDYLVDKNLLKGDSFNMVISMNSPSGILAEAVAIKAIVTLLSKLDVI